MKACITCKHHDKSPASTPQGHRMVDICKHPELGDPVEGIPMMCQVCRGNSEFCGIKGKLWEKKLQEQPKALDEERKVIQLT